MSPTDREGMRQVIEKMDRFNGLLRKLNEPIEDVEAHLKTILEADQLLNEVQAWVDATKLCRSIKSLSK